MGRTNFAKNLTIIELSAIEFHLNENRGFSEIARLLSRHESTIRNEVKNYSTFMGIKRSCSNCLSKPDCHQKYLCSVVPDKVRCSKCRNCSFAPKSCPGYHTNIDCSLLKKNHHVCNSCELFYKCRSIKHRYIAKNAAEKHSIVQTNSFKDIKLDSFPQEFKNYLADRIKHKISPEIIVNTLPQNFSMFTISSSTLYRWIDLRLLDCCNLDLRYKVSRVSSSLPRSSLYSRFHHLNGRSIEDLTADDLTYPFGVVEMDTVEGIKGGDVLLTILIPMLSLMLAFKLSNKSQSCVVDKLNTLEKHIESYYYTLFRKIILDNGSEFLDYNGIESSIFENKKIRSRVFYTHPASPAEKPHVENAHILLRWLIKKGFDLSLLSADDILSIVNRLNNYPRPTKNFLTPLQLLENYLGSEILILLDLHHIPIEDLNMKDMIIY